MADTVGMQDIRGLDIDKTVKGFALTNYIFKNQVNVKSTSADHIRWFQETAGDLTATSPSAVANVSPGSNFPQLEASWTRNTSYVRKYAAEGFITIEDEKSSDIDVYSRTLLRLTRAVIKQVDSHIWDVMTESQSPSNINDITSTGTWDAESGQNPIEDVLDALKSIESNDYNSENAVIYLSPTDKKNLINWAITSNGTKITEYASKLTENGSMMKFLGRRVVVNKNVTADYAAVALPETAVTYHQHTNTTSVAIPNKGIGTTLRVYELGIATLTDPKAVSLISDTQA